MPIDLATLRERSRPTARGTDAKRAFEELLSLRDDPDVAAVPVLCGILEDNAQSSRIHRYAAAQALFAVGSGEARRLLELQALQPGFDGNLAFDYTFHWDMDPDDRDGFLDLCVLRSVGEAPSLELRQVPTAGGAPSRLSFDVTVRNDLDRPIEITDPATRGGELLIFREVGGHDARTLHPATWCLDGRPDVVRPAPGESASLSIVVEIVPAADVPGAGYGGQPSSATIAARSGAWTYLLNRPGSYDVVAWWTSPQGRSVSMPVRVKIPAAH